MKRIGLAILSVAVLSMLFGLYAFTASETAAIDNSYYEAKDTVVCEEHGSVIACERHDFAQARIEVVDLLPFVACEEYDFAQVRLGAVDLPLFDELFGQLQATEGFDITSLQSLVDRANSYDFEVLLTPISLVGDYLTVNLTSPHRPLYTRFLTDDEVRERLVCCWNQVLVSTTISENHTFSFSTGYCIRIEIVFATVCWNCFTMHNTFTHVGPGCGVRHQ